MSIPRGKIVGFSMASARSSTLRAQRGLEFCSGHACDLVHHNGGDSADGNSREMLASRSMKAKDEPAIFGFVICRSSDRLTVAEKYVLPIQGAEYTPVGS